MLLQGIPLLTLLVCLDEKNLDDTFSPVLVKYLIFISFITILHKNSLNKEAFHEKTNIKHTQYQL